MRVEIFVAPFNPMMGVDEPTRLIAIQYLATDRITEVSMRKANALFDVSIRGMSGEMLQCMNCMIGYRTAILELKS